MLHRWYCTNSYFSQSVASFIYDKVDNIGSLIWKFSHKFLPHIFIKRSSSASAKTRKIPKENFSLRFWNSFHFCFISFSNYIHASTSPWVRTTDNFIGCQGRGWDSPWIFWRHRFSQCLRDLALGLCPLPISVKSDHVRYRTL